MRTRLKIKNYALGIFLRYRYHGINVRGKVGVARLGDDAHAVASCCKFARNWRIDDIRATAVVD